MPDPYDMVDRSVDLGRDTTRGLAATLDRDRVDDYNRHMLTIRPEDPGDADAVAALHVRAWQVGYAGLMPAEVLDRLNPVAWAQRRRDVGTAEPDQVFRTLIAVDDEEIAGFVTFGPYRNHQDPDDVDPTYGEVLSLFVHPDRWGRGVGRSLLRAARETLGILGDARLRLWVLAGNHRARRLCQQAGLAADGTRMLYPVPLSGDQPPLPLTELRYTAAGRAGDATRVRPSTMLGSVRTGSTNSRVRLIQT